MSKGADFSTQPGRSSFTISASELNGKHFGQRVRLAVDGGAVVEDELSKITHTFRGNRVLIEFRNISLNPRAFHDSQFWVDPTTSVEVFTS